MNKNSNIKTNSGFTVIEMIVAISIVSILGSIILFNYKGFQDSVDFSNTAQEVALVIKKAQSESIAGKYPTIGLTQEYVEPSTWKPAYGVFFDKQNSKMIYFFDRDNSGQFDSFGENCKQNKSECLEEIVLGKGRTFSRLCIYADEALTGKDCTSNNVSFTFKRPFPSSIIRYQYDPITSTPGFIPSGPGAVVLEDPQITPGGYSVFVSVLGRLATKSESSLASF